MSDEYDRLAHELCEGIGCTRIHVLRESLPGWLRTLAERERAEGAREERARVVALLDSRAKTAEKRGETEAGDFGAMRTAQAIALYEAARDIERVEPAVSPAGTITVPALPTNAEDEALVDGLMRKANEGRAERSMAPTAGEEAPRPAGRLCPDCGHAMRLHAGGVGDRCAGEYGQGGAVCSVCVG